MTITIIHDLYHNHEMKASDILKPEKWNTEKGNRSHDRVLLVLLYGSWNTRLSKKIDEVLPTLSLLKTRDMKDFDIASVRADIDDASYDMCIDTLGAPSELPALVFIGVPSPAAGEDDVTKKLRIEHVSLSGFKLDSLLTHHLEDVSNGFLLRDMVFAWSKLIDSDGKLKPIKQNRVFAKLNAPAKPVEAIRIFIAGDRSQVGKSSICMGILGALLKSGKYSPSDLAYIKPATQCEQTQLVQEFCKAKGITACVPIGPIVYFKGFTRAFLKGEISENSRQLLYKAGNAVDELALGKKIVVIDGVGYPAVGSITGTDNARVAKSCGIKLPSWPSDMSRVPVPVLLIGKQGVGDAVDSFNINATYFAHANVPVIGAIFNKLSLDGFYSLENCKEAIEMYFDKFQPDKRAFGFIPDIPSLKNAREDMASCSEEEQLKHALKTADAFVDQFRQYVNVDEIIRAAKEATDAYKKDHATSENLKKRPTTTSGDGFHHAKYSKATNTLPISQPLSLTRAQIEALASAQGAAGG